MAGFRILSLLLVVCTGLTACAAGPVRPDASDYKRIASYAIPQTEKTALRDALQSNVQAHKDQSGFRLLANGRESLSMRLALVQAAEKTLDLQYYAMHDDGAAMLMLEAILRAAERGVRVRFLIDNISLSDVETSLSILDSNPNIAVRVFNPMTTKSQGLVARLNGFFVDMDKATKRMHNKSLIADNQLAIIGGRNIGDEYFDARPDNNFKDLDLLTAGPITARISRSFDQYWNSDESFPIASLRDRDHTAIDVKKLRADMKAAWEEKFKEPAGHELLDDRLAARLKKAEVNLLWARSELTVDEPGKVDKDAEDATSKPLSKLETLTHKASSEFVAVSPYFVPGDEGVAWLKSLEDRGVHVRVLTNSLASTDVVAVHTGYKRYRQDILESGMELYEFKPDKGERPKQRLLGSSAPPQASLHSKVYVIDRSDVVIGSYNLDPRSNELNTEIAVVIHSPELAAQVMKIFDDSIKPTQSYRLALSEKGELQWITEDEKGGRVFTRDPGAGFLRNSEVMLFSLLPIEGQL